MATVEQRCLIHVDLDTAFHTSQDYACRSQWDPFSKHIQREADGQVTVTAWHGMKMRVEYVAWRPPERAAIRMVRGPSMLKRFAGTWIFSKNSPGLVEVRFRYHFEAAPLWRGLEPFMRRYFNMETRRRLDAFKHYLEHKTNGI